MRVYRQGMAPIPSHYSSTEEDLTELESEGGGDPPTDGQTPPTDPPKWEPPEYLMLGEEQVPWDKAQTWLSQGRNYSQRMHELNLERQQYEPYKALDPNLLNHFKEINDFVQSGEEGQTWWNHVTQSWEKRALPPEMDPNLERIVSPLNSQINELSQQVKDLLSEKTANAVKQEDEALDTEIKSIRDKFANIDFDSVDESGVTLEQRVTNYAAENGFNNWRAAFLDYYHDSLIELAKSEATQKVTSQKANESKKGIMGRSPTPQKPDDVKPYDRNRHKSYEDIHQETLAELGLT